MTRRRLSIVGGTLAVGILALAWWLGSPLLFDKEVDEEFPLSAGAEIPADMTADAVEAEMEKAAGEPDSEVEEDMPAQSGPVALATGGFEGADEAHRGSGTATIYELEDGSRVLRLEDFEVTNGPDLHVYLVPDRSPAGGDDVQGYVDLGSLKGNLGDQNYDIPDEVDPEGFGSVVVYCEPFHVIFSTATLG
jgi:hypothetical protein